MNEEENTNRTNSNSNHAIDNGYVLICDGKYTFELEREWNSILNVVPEDYRLIWSENKYNESLGDNDK